MNPPQDPIAPEFAPGEVLFDVCEIEKLLGEGGMGRVYKVYHRAWDLPLCVKVPRTSSMADAIASQNFERECQTWIDLGLHPNIVTCYYIKRLNELPLIFAEYASNGSLHDWIRSGRLYAGGPQTALARIIDFAIQVAWGLHFAHTRGIVHQDVKPANVMVMADETIKVTDFGLARASRRRRNAALSTDEPAARSGMTPAYASPEQLNGQALDRTSDIWSWAVSVLEMFVGSRVWRVGTAAPAVLDEYCRNALDTERTNRPALPKDLELLLRRCFAHETEERPGDMARVADTLMDIYFGATGQAYERPTPPLVREYGDGLHVGDLNNRAVSMVEMSQTEKAAELFAEAELTARACVNREAMAALQEIAYNRTLLQIRTNPLFNTGSIEALVPHEPDQLKQVLYIGMLHLETGNPIQAADVLLEVVATSQRFLIEAMNIRGICLLLSGETKPAILSFRAAIRLAPELADGYRNLAVACYYDGQFIRGLRAYQRYAQIRRLDLEDASALAVMYAAVGAPEQARRYLATVLKADNRPAAALLSAAELAQGIQTFLPGVCAVPGIEYPGALIGEVLTASPENLRACIDRTTTGRDGVRFKINAKKNMRARPESQDPLQIARCAFASYQPLTGIARWGDLSTSPSLYRAMVLSAVAPILVAILLWPLLLNNDAIQNAFGTVSEGLIRAIWIAMGAALAVIVTRRISPPRLWTDVLFSCGFILALYVPSAAHHAFANAFSDAAVAAIYPEHRQLLLRIFASLAAAATAREIVFRFLASRYRAFGSWRFRIPRPASSSNDSTPRRDKKDSSGANAFDEIPTLQHSLIWSLATSAWARMTPRFARSLRRVRSICGLWQIYLIPEFLILSALDTVWLRWATYPQISAYFFLMLLSNGLLLAYAAFIPRLFVSANTILCLLIGLQVSMLAFPESQLYLVLCFIVVTAALLFANWKAYERCPGFAPLWRSFPDRQWNLMSMVDPLNIRRFATPWKIVRVTNPKPESVNGTGAGGLVGFKL